MYRFRQLINKNPNRVTTLRSLRQSSNKVHRNTITLPLWHKQRLHHFNGFWCSILDFWQTKQAYTNSTTSLFIPGHQNNFLRSWYIFVARGWILKLLLWHSSRIFRLSLGTSGTQTRSRNLITLISSNLKSFSLPWLIDTKQSTSSKSTFWPLWFPPKYYSSTSTFPTSLQNDLSITLTRWGEPIFHTRGLFTTNPQGLYD